MDKECTEPETLSGAITRLYRLQYPYSTALQTSNSSEKENKVVGTLCPSLHSSDRKHAESVKRVAWFVLRSRAQVVLHVLMGCGWSNHVLVSAFGTRRHCCCAVLHWLLKTVPRKNDSPLSRPERRRGEDATTTLTLAETKSTEAHGPACAKVAGPFHPRAYRVAKPRGLLVFLIRLPVVQGLPLTPAPPTRSGNDDDSYP